MKVEPGAISGMKVTIMGLGVNGGGLASALYFARRGARVTVTDLRPASVLKTSMDSLGGFAVRYVLERHDEQDFAAADLVIKNPAVSPSSPFLAAARSRGVPVETDLSIFLSLCRNPICAVTGSKGKSTTASAIAHVLGRVKPGARLGGNITVSPLSFLDELGPEDPVVLELSSWQLGDLRGRGLLRPRVSVFTVILPDHLDKYGGMEDYVADKKVIFQEQDPSQCAVLNRDDPWQKDFASETRARPFFYSRAPLPAGVNGAWLEAGSGFARLEHGAAPQRILGDAALPGEHNRMNLIAAGLSLSLFGVQPGAIVDGLAGFRGVEHRLEHFRTWNGIRFYNDSAATIPHATVSALKALTGPIVLLTGGTDKNIDFSPVAETASIPRFTVLLAGTGTEKMRAIYDERGVPYRGPFGSLAEALAEAMECARQITGAGEVSLLFSPGCTSFGMFVNEFDRGRKFKEMVLALTPEA